MMLIVDQEYLIPETKIKYSSNSSCSIHFLAVMNCVDDFVFTNHKCTVGCNPNYIMYIHNCHVPQFAITLFH